MALPPNTIILWTRPDSTVVATQVLDLNVDIDAEIAKIQADNPDLTYRLTTTLDEYPISINPFYPALVLDDDNQLAYYMVKAREIFRQGLRIRREPVLAKLDIEYQRALEAGNKTLQQEIVAKKNILRDCTDDPAIAAAKDLNDLMRAIPELLAD